MPLHGEAKPILGFIPGQGGLGDGGYNDMAYRGMIQAKMALDGVLIVEQVDSVEYVPDALERMISQGASVLVLNGYEYSEVVKPTVKAHPQVRFILNEGSWPGTDNSKAIAYDHRSVAFLAGALSSLVTNTGKLGFIGALETPLIELFLEGFRSGARHWKKDTKVYVSYLSDSSGGFNMTDQAYWTALDMAQMGVDVVLSVAGLSNNGALQGAKERGIYFVAVDDDKDHVIPGTVLVSLLKRVDRAIMDEVIEAANGAFSPGEVTLSLGDGVDLSDMAYTKEAVGTKILAQIEILRKTLIEGGI